MRGRVRLNPYAAHFTRSTCPELGNFSSERTGVLNECVLSAGIAKGTIGTMGQTGFDGGPSTIASYGKPYCDSLKQNGDADRLSRLLATQADFDLLWATGIRILTQRTITRLQPEVD